MDHKPGAFVSVSSNLSSSSPPTDNNFDLKNQISPTVLLIIFLLSIIFFVSGLLHLLVRFLRTSRTRLDDAYEENALNFDLHNSGIKQSLIDALPVFHYKTIIGLKHDPFDCAVCLSEFKAEDELRLLPKCSHAFHVGCIDTWLLTNSTCPLCRDNILLDLTASPSPLVLELESDVESSRDSNSHLGSTHFDQVVLKSGEISSHNDEHKPENDERLFLVQLGKFKNIDATKDHRGGRRSRRSFSTGSLEYVMPEGTFLQAHVAMKKIHPTLSQGSAHRPVNKYKDVESFSMTKSWLTSLDEIRDSAGRKASSFRVSGEAERFR